MSAVTAEILRNWIAYNPETGVFVWRLGRRAGYKAGGLWNTGYVRIKILGETHCAHRLAWLWMTGEWPASEIDHVNRHRDDNRWSNLRLATTSQNHGNKPRQRNNKIGLKGVVLRKGRYYVATCRKIHLGYFSTPQEAHAAYCKAASEAFGEFASGQ